MAPIPTSDYAQRLCSYSLQGIFLAILGGPHVVPGVRFDLDKHLSCCIMSLAPAYLMSYVNDHTF